jgi:hypothetical protein
MTWWVSLAVTLENSVQSSFRMTSANLYFIFAYPPDLRNFLSGWRPPARRRLSHHRSEATVGYLYQTRALGASTQYQKFDVDLLSATSTSVGVVLRNHPIVIFALAGVRIFLRISRWIKQVKMGPCERPGWINQEANGQTLSCGRILR